MIAVDKYFNRDPRARGTWMDELSSVIGALLKLVERNKWRTWVWRLLKKKGGRWKYK